MGGKSTKIEPDLEPTEVFKTVGTRNILPDCFMCSTDKPTDNVQGLLVTFLYSTWDPVRQQLEEVFHSRAVIDENISQKCKYSILILTRNSN
jgi:hypothetical protein